ncbi:hypothetical protein D3C76_1453560 [compost metagenome]
MAVATKNKTVTASYSRRRHEVYVLNHEGVQIFSIQGDQLKGVPMKALTEDDALLDWVLNHYSDVLEDLL